MNRSQPTPLIIPVGDPAGIGTEVVLKALADPMLCARCAVTLVGTRSHLEALYHTHRGEAWADPAQFPMIDLPLGEAVTVGQGTAATGAASFAYLDRAIAETIAGHYGGIVTAPIAKHLWQAAGHDFPGQTEVLAARAGVERFGMAFVARSPYTDWQLITLLATTHIPLRAVPDTLTPDLMARKLDLLLDCLRRDFAMTQPTIAIAGLNPHSGEDGNLGTEEQAWLTPWLEQERRDRPGVTLLGPVPPDTLWVKPGQGWFRDAHTPGLADAYLALYHDQGLIPVKLMGFDQAINTTIGLPFIRTSPDHGTAFDIAGRNLANPASMKAAIALAAELVEHRASPTTP